MEEEPWQFTCKDCDCRELVVIHEWGVFDGLSYLVYKEWGYLDEGHRWEIEESELVEELDNEDKDMGQEEPEADDESHEFWVECAECEREIEFGWSHPDRGGRIWPAECSDFNPWKSWPEPKYRESWRQKNWLRPS
jgi:hypothetical protein